MNDHLQRVLLAGVLGLTIARKAAAILDVDGTGASQDPADSAGTASNPGRRQRVPRPFRRAAAERAMVRRATAPA